MILHRLPLRRLPPVQGNLKNQRHLLHQQGVVCSRTIHDVANVCSGGLWVNTMTEMELKHGGRWCVDIKYVLVTPEASIWISPSFSATHMHSSGAVPHFITSNTFIAKAYARVIKSWIRDIRHRLDMNQPLYIIELGTGSGKVGIQ